MKLVRYCGFMLLVTIPLCQAEQTDQSWKFVCKGSADAALAVVSAYVAYHTVKTGYPIVKDELKDVMDRYDEEKGTFRKAVTRAVTNGADATRFASDIVTPLAYAGLLWVTGKTAVMRAFSAINNFKQAYTGETKATANASKN